MTIDVQGTVNMVQGNASGCTDPITGDTYAFDQNGNSCGGGSGYASGTGTPLTSGSMTDEQMQLQAEVMCRNSGQAWDRTKQACANTLIAGVSNAVVYALGGALLVMVLFAAGKRR